MGQNCQSCNDCKGEKGLTYEDTAPENSYMVKTGKTLKDVKASYTEASISMSEL